MVYSVAFLLVILAAVASVPAYADCKAFPGKDLVVLVTVSSEFEMMFKNWLLHSSKFLTSSQQLVVWPEDNAIVDKLGLFQASSPTPFDVAKPEKFDVPSPVHRNFIRKETSQKTQVIDTDADMWYYGSNNYKRLVNSRPSIILHYLHQGCTVLYSDIDTVWLKSPFNQIAAAGNYDMYVTDDSDKGILDSGYVCTCFLYMKPTSPALQLVKRWEDITHDPSYLSGHGGNQKGFNTALREVSQTNLATCLPQDQFPSGRTASRYSASKLHDTTVLHANYLKGVTNKTNCLKTWGVWDVDK